MRCTGYGKNLVETGTRDEITGKGGDIMSGIWEEARKKAEQYDQKNILRYFDELDNAGRDRLCSQIMETDFSVLSTLTDTTGGKRGVITPMDAMRLSEIEERKEEFRNVGLQTIREGKVAAVLLAGGMGTRLGSDDPKGVYNIGITKDVFIFQRLVENLMDVVRESGTFIDLYVMTSEKNDEKTRAFFEEKQYFGYEKEHVFFFRQETAPATDYEGQIYLEEKDRMATSPNGNGGWFLSLERTEIGKRMNEKGIEWLNVFAVDNVLQRIADPVFIGATIRENCLVGEKVIKKSAPDEKVGAICLEDGRPSIIEYYELTPELMGAKNENGENAYDFGVILNYLFDVKELRRIADKALPFHRVEKKIPYLSGSGGQVKPSEPNGYKYEALVLDMVHEMDRCLAFEVEREKEFAPIKNKTGVDSVESARELLRRNGIDL